MNLIEEIKKANACAMVSMKVGHDAGLETARRESEARITELETRCRALWALLKWAHDNNGECMGDHPTIMRQTHAALYEVKL